MVIRTIALGLLGLVLTGCASISGNSEESNTETPQPTNQLSARDLGPGDCGLFVWTMPPDRRFILFSDNVSGAAAWFNAGEERNLILQDKAGDPAYGQYAEQSFTGTDGQVLELSLIQGEDIVQGTRFPEGTLKISGEDGWRKVVPVSALAACQPAAS